MGVGDDIEGAIRPHASQPARALLALSQLALDKVQDSFECGGEEGLGTEDTERLLAESILHALIALVRNKEGKKLSCPSVQEVWPIAFYAFQVLARSSPTASVIWEDRLATKIFPPDLRQLATQLGRLLAVEHLLAGVLDSLARSEEEIPPLRHLPSGTIACIMLMVDVKGLQLTSQTTRCFKQVVQGSSNSANRQQLLGQVFAAIVDLLQADTFEELFGEHAVGSEQMREVGSVAYKVLELWRHDAESCDDLWDACLVAILKRLLEGSPTELSLAKHVLIMLAQPERAAWSLQILIAFSTDKKETKRAFRVFAAIFRGDIASLLNGCSGLLKPDSNCALDARCEAIAAMEEACLCYVKNLGEEVGKEQLTFWPDEALQLVLYTLKSDPSIRMRRAALKLLRHCVVENGSMAEVHILEVLLLKCRDLDGKVRQIAFAMAKQLPPPLLAKMLEGCDWQKTLAIGLLGMEAIWAAVRAMEHGEEEIAQAYAKPVTWADAFELATQVVTGAKSNQEIHKAERLVEWLGLN